MSLGNSSFRIRTLLAATALGLTAIHPVTAATFNLAEIAWPTGAEVITSADLSNFSNADRATSAPYTLSQTFLVESPFEANSAFFSYRNKLTESITTRVQIFEVADRFAATLPETPDAAAVVYEAVVESPSTLLDPVNDPNGSRVVGQILFDNPVLLSPTLGSAGYAIRFTDLDGSGEWRGYRKGGGDAVEGEIYTDGNGYRNLNERGFNRDYAVALSSINVPVPEPTTGGLLVAALGSAAARRRRA